MKNSDENKNETSNDSEHSMGQLAYLSLKEENRPEWDPYILYAQRMRSHIGNKPKKFIQNFKKGYEVLLEVLKEQGSNTTK